MQTYIVVNTFSFVVLSNSSGIKKASLIVFFYVTDSNKQLQFIYNKESKSYHGLTDEKTAPPAESQTLSPENPT